VSAADHAAAIREALAVVTGGGDLSTDALIDIDDAASAALAALLAELEAARAASAEHEAAAIEFCAAADKAEAELARALSQAQYVANLLERTVGATENLLERLAADAEATP
jgi:hypothetical protein